MKDLIDRTATRLRAAGIESPRAEARRLLAYAVGASIEDVIAERVVSDAASTQRFEAAIARRVAHEPLAYITGEREFWSLRFAVGPEVLIPRPESEVLVESALKRFAQRDAAFDVLDLGTGSGCLLLAFLSERPNARGMGVDCSAGALGCATDNARRLGLTDRASFLCLDWRELPERRFDLILANPPYIRSGDIAGLSQDVAKYEPRSALDGGADGLAAYRTIATLVPRLLNAGGAAFIELGQGQSEGVAALFEATELTVEGFVNDLAYIPRCLIAGLGPNGPQVKRKKDMEMERRSG